MRFIRPLLAALAAFVALGAPLPAAEAAPGDVVVVPLDGAVSAAQTAFLRRTLKDAERGGASAYVIEMNTPGGELGAAVDILQLLLKARIPTYTWVNTNAGSAGALIALASDHVYMAPVSAIGAAAPVSGDGKDIGETMKDKTVSYYSGYFRSAAEAKGRNPALAEAFINKEKEFKIGDDVINAKGSLLTLSAQEATRKFDGKPLLADGIAASIDQLKSEAKLTGPTVIIHPTGFERVAQWITVLAPLFLVAGVAAAYMEFKTPGFGVAGFLSLVCFAIFFLGHYVAGLSGLEVAMVFVFGLILILVELLLFPGVVFLAALGIALMLGSVFFAMVDHFPGQAFTFAPEALLRPSINFGITLVFAIAIVALLARFFPQLPFFRGLILAASPVSGPAMDSPTPLRPAISVGMTGVSRSMLRPAGKAEIGEQLVDVVTEGEFIDADTPVRVVEANSARVVVVSA